MKVITIFRQKENVLFHMNLNFMIRFCFHFSQAAFVYEVTAVCEFGQEREKSRPTTFYGIGEFLKNMEIGMGCQRQWVFFFFFFFFFVNLMLLK